MKILSAASLRSEGSTFIEFFHFRGLLLVSDLKLSRNFDRYLQRGKVNGARKGLFTLSVTLAFTLASEQVPKQERVSHDRMDKMAAEWHRVGLGCSEMWAGLWVEVFGTTPRNLLETNGGPGWT
jgi:hypothetical protein